MESSIVMRCARTFSKVSLRIGQPPTRRPTPPISCREGFPKLEPYCRCRKGYERNPGGFRPVQAMTMIVATFVAVAMIMIVVIVPRLISWV
jgi:hypothetical protein